jgi:hypothetical protein
MASFPVPIPNNLLRRGSWTVLGTAQGMMPSQKNLTGSYRNALKPWKRKIETDETDKTCAQFERQTPNLCPV